LAKILACDYIFVDARNGLNLCNGLIRSSIIFKEKLYLRLEFFKILGDINIVLDSIIKNINDNPSNENLVNLIDTERVNWFDFGWGEVTTFLEQILTPYVNINVDRTKYYKIKLYDKLEVILHWNDINRIYRFVKGYVDGYFVLEGMIKLLSIGKLDNNINIESNSDLKNEKRNNNQSIDQNTIENNIDNNNDKETLIDQIIPNNLINRANLDVLFGELVNTIIRYYSHIKINDVKKLPRLLYRNNYEYYHSLFYTICENITIDEAKYIIKNCWGVINNNLSSNDEEELNSILILSCYNLIFWMSLVISRNLHSQYVDQNLFQIINNIDGIQGKVIKYGLGVVLGEEFKNTVSIDVDEDYPEEFDKLNETNTNNIVEEISEKYSYLKSVDVDEFVESVYQEIFQSNTNSAPHQNIQFSKPKILNIKKIIENNALSSIHSNNINFINKLLFSDYLIKLSSSNNQSNNMTKYGILNYQYYDENKKIISLPYKYFISYLKSPAEINKIIENETSVVIHTTIKLFPFFDKFFVEHINKNTKNTLIMYQLLDKNLDKSFDSNFIKYLAFQMIIPHCWYNFGRTSFEEELL